jgi:hypothetical protein
MGRDGFGTIEINCVQRVVLAKIVHPAPCSSLFNEILNDDLLDPFPSFRIREVNNGHINTHTFQKVRTAVRLLKEVAFLYSLFKLVLPQVGRACQVSEIWVQVDHWLDTVIRPPFHKLLPIRVLVEVKLPVPLQPVSLGVSVSADPVLHPKG